MRRILFVDDDPNVLAGLRRMLRPLRTEWDMAFVESGRKALETLAGSPFDVVVSDMRMPGMDGAELLTKVKQDHPQIVRIALSGHSEKELLLRSTGPTHMFLAKPCDAETLKQAVARSVNLRDMLADESLQRVAAQVSCLPSLPDLYHEIVEELEGEDSSMRRVGEIISKDLGMTAKILQLVNSAFFGLRRHVSDPAQAVSLLGLETINGLVLSIHVFSQFDGASVEGFSLNKLWEHSVATGALAKRIAREGGLGPEDVDYALLAGLLHDTGELVLVANLPEEYAKVLQAAGAKGITVWEAELEIFGTTHAAVGAYLLGLWALPDPIVEAIAYHHQPSACQAEAFCPLTAVHVADALEHEQMTQDKGAGQLDTEYLSRIGLGDRVTTWQDICRELVRAGDNR